MLLGDSLPPCATTAISWTPQSVLHDRDNCSSVDATQTNLIVVDLSDQEVIIPSAGRRAPERRSLRLKAVVNMVCIYFQI